MTPIARGGVPYTPMRCALILLAMLVPAAARAETRPAGVRCADRATDDIAIDGLLDDWPRQVHARIGTANDGAFALRCAWDGSVLAIAIDAIDDRVVRVPGKGHEDYVEITVSAGGRAARVVAYPGTKLAKSRVTTSSKVTAADSLQPKGFSVEARIPAAALAGFSQSTPSLDARIAFRDSDLAAGGDADSLDLALTIELGDRKDLLDDFLAATKLRRADIRLDKLAELDPDRRGKERIVAGGTVIGILTDQFAYATLPITRAADVRKLELLPLGRRGLHVISAVVRQSGNGGSRDLLMLWTVWSGQLHALGQIEIRKQLGTNILEAGYKIVKGKQGPELVVEAKPAVGFTAETWNEEPAQDADPILLPWDPVKRGIAYTLTGAELARRDLPAQKKR